MENYTIPLCCGEDRENWLFYEGAVVARRNAEDREFFRFGNYDLHVEIGDGGGYLLYRRDCWTDSEGAAEGKPPVYSEFFFCASQPKVPGELLEKITGDLFLIF